VILLALAGAAMHSSSAGLALRGTGAPAGGVGGARGVYPAGAGLGGEGSGSGELGVLGGALAAEARVSKHIDQWPDDDDEPAGPVLKIFTMYSPKYKKYWVALEDTFARHASPDLKLKPFLMNDVKMNKDKKKGNKMRGVPTKIDIIVWIIRENLGETFCYLDTTSLFVQPLQWRPQAGVDLYFTKESQWGNPNQKVNIGMICGVANDRTLAFFQKVSSEITNSHRWDQEVVNTFLEKATPPLARWDFIPSENVQVLSDEIDDCLPEAGVSILKFISLSSPKETAKNPGLLYQQYKEFGLGQAPAANSACRPELVGRVAAFKNLQAKWASDRKAADERKRLKREEEEQEEKERLRAVEEKKLAKIQQAQAAERDRMRQRKRKACMFPDLRAGELTVVLAGSKYRKSSEIANHYIWSAGLSKAKVIFYRDRKDHPEVAERRWEGKCGMYAKERKIDSSSYSAAFFDFVSTHYTKILAGESPRVLVFLREEGAIAWHTSCEAVFSRMHMYYEAMATPNQYPGLTSHMMSLLSGPDGTAKETWYSNDHFGVVQYLNGAFGPGDPVQVTLGTKGSLLEQRERRIRSPCQDTIFSSYGIDFETERSLFRSQGGSFILPLRSTLRYPQAFYQSMRDYLKTLSMTKEGDEGFSDAELGDAHCFEHIVYDLFPDTADPHETKLADLKEFYDTSYEKAKDAVVSKRSALCKKRRQECQSKGCLERPWVAPSESTRAVVTPEDDTGLDVETQGGSQETIVQGEAVEPESSGDILGEGAAVTTGAADADLDGPNGAAETDLDGPGGAADTDLDGLDGGTTATVGGVGDGPIESAAQGEQEHLFDDHNLVSCFLVNISDPCLSLKGTLDLAYDGPLALSQKEVEGDVSYDLTGAKPEVSPLAQKPGKWRRHYRMSPELEQLLPETDSHEGVEHEKCAVVGNAGSLIQGGFASDIDGHDLILRFNGAPTSTFEGSVGSKTTHDILNFENIRALAKGALQWDEESKASMAAAVIAGEEVGRRSLLTYSSDFKLRFPAGTVLTMEDYLQNWYWKDEKARKNSVEDVHKWKTQFEKQKRWVTKNQENTMKFLEKHKGAFNFEIVSPEFISWAAHVGYKLETVLQKKGLLPNDFVHVSTTSGFYMVLYLERICKQVDLYGFSHWVDGSKEKYKYFSDYTPPEGVHDFSLELAKLVILAQTLDSITLHGYH